MLLHNASSNKFTDNDINFHQSIHGPWEYKNFSNQDFWSQLERENKLHTENPHGKINEMRQTLRKKKLITSEESKYITIPKRLSI